MLVLLFVLQGTNLSPGLLFLSEQLAPVVTRLHQMSWLNLRLAGVRMGHRSYGGAPVTHRQAKDRAGLGTFLSPQILRPIPADHAGKSRRQSAHRETPLPLAAWIRSALPAAGRTKPRAVDGDAPSSPPLLPQPLHTALPLCLLTTSHSLLISASATRSSAARSLLPRTDNYRLEPANFYFCKAVRDLCLLLLSPRLPVA